eukprot:COSAG02_NODE_1435_length_12610_cov_7.021181_15_plen_110_part_00
MSNANVPQTLFHIFFLPSICQPNSTQLNSAQLSSCNSAQLSSANYLVAQLSSANYLVAQVGSARPTHKTITTYNVRVLTLLERIPALDCEFKVRGQDTRPFGAEGTRSR